MTEKKTSTVDRNVKETALRDVWYARVLAEQGRDIAIKVDLPNSATDAMGARVTNLGA